MGSIELVPQTAFAYQAVDDNSDAASTNAIIVECLQVNTDINQQLEELLNSRYDGAANIRGIRYQVAYSLLRAFGLYEG